jgi:hypothetical protein
MKSAAERQKAWRQKRDAEGFRMVTVWLDPDVARELEKVTGGQKQHTERQRIINQALRRQMGISSPDKTE